MLFIICVLVFVVYTIGDLSVNDKIRHNLYRYQIHKIVTEICSIFVFGVFPNLIFGQFEV